MLHRSSMANIFTLSPDGAGWQGKAGAALRIQVVPQNTTQKISIENPDYPGSADLKATGDTLTTSVVSGRGGLTVHIAPRTEPPVIWSVVEVGIDKATRVLGTVNDPFRAGDPFGTTITITGA
jgi:hypothetical protein